MIQLQALVRPSILNLRAYSSARSLVTEASVFLDANESPVSPEFGTGLSWENTLNRYPSPQPALLLEKFSNIYGVPRDKILVGRGSDEAIDLLTRALCEPKKDAVLITPPTYGMYQVAADIQDTPVIKIPLRLSEQDWKLDLENIIAQLRDPQKNIKMIYICSPNNPTGTAFPQEDIRQILKALPPTTLLVLDEAYGEFSKQAAGLELLKEYPQLVVLRTLSKAWGLAGLRCGVVMADPQLIRILQKVLAPYPLPQPVIQMALQALEDVAGMRKRVAQLIEERGKLKGALLKMSQVVRVFPSETNFLLVEFKSSAAVMAATAQKGIVVRNRSGEISNCVRISVGTPNENSQLLASLESQESL